MRRDLHGPGRDPWQGPPADGASRGRLALFTAGYLLTVPGAVVAAEAAAAWLWPLLAAFLEIEPWPGATLPEGMGGPLGGNYGLFLLRGGANLALVLAWTAFFQRILWQGRRRLSHLGLGRGGSLVELGEGVLVGAGAMFTVYLLLRAFGWVTWPAPAPPAEVPSGWAIPALVLGFAFLAASEEVVTRGFLLQNLAQGWGFGAAATLQALLFGAVHLANPHAGLASTAGIFTAGLFLAAGVARTGRLWLPIGAHLAWNLVEGVVLGLPLSGQATFRFFRAELTGPVAATGGSFGPEAGWVAALVLLAFAVGLGSGAGRRAPS